MPELIIKNHLRDGVGIAAEVTLIRDLIVYTAAALGVYVFIVELTAFTMFPTRGGIFRQLTWRIVLDLRIRLVLDSVEI